MDKSGTLTQDLVVEEEPKTTIMCFFEEFRWPNLLQVGAAGCVFLCATGCSNEFMNSAMYSDQTRIEKFREYHDRQIGEPYYGLESVVCENHVCSVPSDGWLEIVHVGVFEEHCTIAWTVERSQTGKYHHRNGMILDIVGVKRRWRYLSDPHECLYGLDWEGPW